MMMQRTALKNLLPRVSRLRPIARVRYFATEDEVDFTKIIQRNEKINQEHAHLDRSKFTEVVDVRIPNLNSESFEASKVLRWYKNVGDIVVFEDTLCDVETPEFTFGVEVEDEDVGVLDAIMVQSGEEIPENRKICRILHFKKEKNETSQHETQDESKVESPVQQNTTKDS